MISSLTVGEKDDESPKGHKKGHFQALKFTSHGLAFCRALNELLTDALLVATLLCSSSPMLKPLKLSYLRTVDDGASGG